MTTMLRSSGLLPRTLAPAFALAFFFGVSPDAFAQAEAPNGETTKPDAAPATLPTSPDAGALAPEVKPEAKTLPAPKLVEPATAPVTAPVAAPATSEAVPAVRTPAADTAAAKTASDTTSPIVASKSFGDLGSFQFGSYGRVNIASDLRGRTGKPTDIVAHGSRVDEESYAELELRREDKFGDDIKTRIVTTLALLPPFFHFSGKPQDSIAVRQLYAQGTYKDWTIWGGARMYRGDDIYLLNWWPLDNQNTVGGGVGKKFESDTLVSVHAGMQRLDNPFQYQQIPNVAPYGFGSVPVTYLDRPRTIETIKVTQFYRNGDRRHPFGSDKAGMKAIVYGELHQLPSGVTRDTTLNTDKQLQSEAGFLLGAQFTYWTGNRDGYVSVWARHARGLAAYDPLATPITFGQDKNTSNATETQFAVAGNYETGPFGLLFASYLRFFRDGSVSSTSHEKYDEGILIARPQAYFGEHFGLGVEGSYQVRRYQALERDTNKQLTASLLRGAIMPYFSPSGRGAFKRPQIGLIYAFTSRDAGARSLYASEDVFSQRGLEHYAGIFTEWWFNSSSYP
ncbi:MAG: carbohydrate porin [Polyangiaceae bacterium]